MKPFWRQLSLLVILFFIIIILIQGSSLFLFYSYYIKPGLTTYYFGGEHALAKTMEGLLEVIIPHIAAQGIILFLVSHFLILAKNKSKICDTIAIALIISGLLNLFASPIVLLTKIVYIKVFTFVAYQILLSISLVLIFKSLVLSHLRSDTIKFKFSLR